MTKVSIITPAYIDTYDKLDWFEEMLKSVKMQSLTDWEVIIIDDYSPVPLDVLKNQFKPPKFRWFKTPKQTGPALCRNTAVRLAQGEAIFPLDADDQLAQENALEVLFNAWQKDKSKFYYGNIQQFVKQDKEFTRGKVLNLLEYDFKQSLNKNGIMPVSCMHSYDCWFAAGGWKNELDAGREDVEYWISAGKAGFCGQKVHELTLLYRKHESSRDYQLRQVNRRISEMVNKLRLMHSDVYEGKYPMSCCGGRGGYVPPPTSNGRTTSAPSTLDQYPEEELSWVEYKGARQGGFGINGPFTSYSYQIKGIGHKLQVHIQDLSRFRSAGRGKDFLVGVTPPQEYIKPDEPEPQEYKGPEPQLATIEQLDEIANG